MTEYDSMRWGDQEGGVSHLGPQAPTPSALELGLYRSTRVSNVRAFYLQVLANVSPDTELSSPFALRRDRQTEHGFSAHSLWFFPKPTGVCATCPLSRHCHHQALTCPPGVHSRAQGPRV